MSKIRISKGEDSFCTEIEVDGEKLKDVASAQLDFQPNSLPVLTLNLISTDGPDVVIDGAVVRKHTEPAINFLGDLQRLRPEPGDVFVLQCDDRLTAESAKRIEDHAKAFLAGASVLVLGRGMRLGCVAMPPAPKPEPSPAASGIARVMKGY